MSQKLEEVEPDPASVEYSMSTKEFLHIEKSCDAFKDSDDEIKSIFNEIQKLAGSSSPTDSKIVDDVDDVELILKRAEDIAHETEELLKSSPISAFMNSETKNCSPAKLEKENIPQIKVTTPNGNETKKVVNRSPIHKANCAQKHNKENEVRRKLKARPSSTSVIESKKRAEAKSKTNSPKKVSAQYEALMEQLKDTNERAKSLELMNVKLVEDNKALRRKLEQIGEKHHIAELKLSECEKFISRLGKEYENRTNELKAVRENESRVMAELYKERNERKNLKTQRDKDATVIQDLQRQCKEMEQILKRKHPDSVSALIVAAKSSTVEDNKKKLLEERIARLEQELKDKEQHFQTILVTLQEKFTDMKHKYENHIIDVERQLMDDKKLNTELRNKLNKCNLVDIAVQTVPKSTHTGATQTFLRAAERASSAASRLTQNSALILNRLKEDSYLVATIKGLQAELTAKQRTIAKINRETEELRKNLRGLQKEKEVLMNLNPSKKTLSKPSKSAENILSRVNSEMEGELSAARRQKQALMEDNNGLMELLKKSNEEYITLKKKRIQDLHQLQVAHEKELMQMNMQIYPLQEEIKLLNRTVEILQDRVQTSEEKLMRYQAGIRYDMAGGDNNFTSKSNFKKDFRG